jgi:ABC-2 type transport system permease protein
MQGLIVFCISLIAGFRPDSWAMLPVAFVFMFTIALLFTALGTAIASMLEDMQGFQLIMNFLVMPLFFLSGALFPLEGLTGAMAVVTRVDPLSYGVDAIRGTLTGLSHFGLGLDIAVLAIVTALCMVIGSKLFERIQV